jgi:3-dehydroshikimate dehydratase
MILPSLLSITFRKLPAEEVVRLAAANGIRAIEWGGDVHAPPRDEAALIRVRDLTREAGLSVCAYGSYFRIGETDPAKPGFTEVLAAAKILGAPLIRVWVGLRGSAEISTEERVSLVAEARRIADQAQAEGIIVACEWHSGTITDVEESALAFLQAVDHPNFRSLWQPHPGQSEEASTAGLLSVLPWLVHIHVFSWWPLYERHPLAYREQAWRQWFAIARNCPKVRSAGLEFVLDDDPVVFARDAALLVDMLR